MRSINSSGVRCNSSTLVPRLSLVGSLRCLAQRSRSSHARSRHTVPWQSRAQRCRIPDICERPGAQRDLGCGGLPGRQTGSRWPAQARSRNARQCFGTAACVRGGGGCRAWVWLLLLVGLQQALGGLMGGANGVCRVTALWRWRAWSTLTPRHRAGGGNSFTLTLPVNAQQPESGQP